MGEPPPPGFAGYFRLDAVDAINMTLHPGGHFEWHITGCDAFGGGDGVWAVADGTSARVAVRPMPSEPSLPWVNDVGESAATSAELSLTDTPGQLSAHVVIAPNELPVPDQVWRSGGTCTACGGGLGPSGRRPCERPF
jgi:hypothetical protein